MKIAVRYYTRGGNTKKLALAIAEAVGVGAQDISAPLTERVDLLFLGSSYYAFDVDDAVKDFLRANKANIGRIANFGTAAMMGSTKKQVAKVAVECGIEMTEQEFHCRGSFGFIHKGRPNEQDLVGAAQFAQALVAAMASPEEA